jgi:hypothetical protein
MVFASIRQGLCSLPSRLTVFVAGLAVVASVPVTGRACWQQRAGEQAYRVELGLAKASVALTVTVWLILAKMRSVRGSMLGFAELPKLGLPSRQATTRRLGTCECRIDSVGEVYNELEAVGCARSCACARWIDHPRSLKRHQGYAQVSFADLVVWGE